MICLAAYLRIARIFSPCWTDSLSREHRAPKEPLFLWMEQKGRNWISLPKQSRESVSTGIRILLHFKIRAPEGSKSAPSADIEAITRGVLQFTRETPCSTRGMRLRSSSPIRTGASCKRNLEDRYPAARRPFISPPSDGWPTRDAWV